MANITPFSTRMIFLKVGWMNRYEGISKGDAISGGGSYVEEHGFGHEIFNFQPFENAVYGYVQPAGGHHTIAIRRLGASNSDESIEDVLAVWVAKDPVGGAYIVGWYEKATIFKGRQGPPKNSDRKHSSSR